MPTNRINQVPTTPTSSSPGTAVPDTSNADTNQPPRRRRRKSATSGTVLNQSVAVRDQLRVTLSGVKDLIRTLKAEKRSQKSLKLALDSLKQLQHAA